MKVLIKCILIELCNLIKEIHHHILIIKDEKGVFDKITENDHIYETKSTKIIFTDLNTNQSLHLFLKYNDILNDNVFSKSMYDQIRRMIKDKTKGSCVLK